MEHGYVSTPEGQIHYITAGDGEPLILLHQNPRSSREFLAMTPLLAREPSRLRPRHAGVRELGPAAG